MKRGLFSLIAVLLLSAVCLGAGSPPSAPSPVSWTSSGTLIENYRGTGGTVYWRIITCYTDSCDTSIFSKSSTTLPTIFSFNGMLSAGRGDFDTVNIATRLRINSENFTDLTGNRLSNVAGALSVVLTGDGIASNEIDNQTIVRADIDTTATFVFGAAYETTSADSLKLYKTKRYVDSTSIAGLPFATWSSGQAHDKIPKLDTTGGLHLTWADDAGAAGGDNVTFDSTIAAGGSWSTTNVYLIADPDSGISITRNGFTDSVFIKGTVANAVSVNGDTAASGKTWRWPSGRFTDLDYIAVDTIFSAYRIESGYLGATTVDAGGIYAGNYGFGASIRISSQANGSILFNDDTTFAGTAAFTITGDTLYGRTTVKSAIKDMESIRTDTAIINGVTIASDASLADEVEVSDSLASYVRIVAENVRDSGAAGNDWVIAGSGGTNALHIKQQVVAGDDTTSIYNGDGTATGMGVFRLKGKSVQITGGTGSTVFGSAVQFNSTANHSGQNIDSANHVDADTLIADAVLRLNGSTVATSYIGLKAPASPTTTVFTMPGADGTSGQALLTNGSGALSFGTVSGSGGSGSALYMTDSSAVHQLDSAIIKVPTGGGLALTMQQIDPGIDTLRISASGLTGSNFATDAGIADETEVGDSLAVVYRQKYAATSAYGTDSMWFNSGTNGIRLINIKGKHTGGDSTFIEADAGGGLVLGKASGNTYLTQDSVFIKTAAYFGFSPNVRVDSAFIDSIRANEFGPGAGVAGDITAVGSMTTGDAFASGAADGAWLGLGASAGRVQFEANGAGTADDYVEVPTGSLVIGTATSASLNGLYLLKGNSGDLLAQFSNFDSTNGSGMWGYYTSTAYQTGSVGGDAGIVIATNLGFGGVAGSVEYRQGIDRSDSFSYKIQLSDVFGVVANGIELDSSGNTRFNGPSYQNAVIADSALATRGYVKKRIPVQITASAGDVFWYYPASGADSSVQLTFPYVPAEGVDTTFLMRCSTIAGADTTFGPTVAFNVPDSMTVDSFIIYLRTSSATADSSKIDSVYFTYTGADAVTITEIGGNGTDRVGTALTRYAMACSRAATPGEIIRARLRIVLKQNNSFVTVLKAQIKGSKRS